MLLQTVGVSDASRANGKGKSYAGLNRRLAKKYEEWMVAQHYASDTQKAYIPVLRSFCEFLGPKSLTSVSHLDVRAFITRTSEEGASLGKVYRQLGILRVFYDFLNLGGLMDFVPPRFLRLRPPNHKMPPVPTETQVQRLISAANTPRERAMLEFFYGTGCRLREMRNLKVSDLNLSERSARVLGKGGKTRDVLLTDTAITALKNYLGTRQSGYVFQPEWARQKAYLSAHRDYWYANWRDYKGERDTPRRSKILGRLDQMDYATAKKAFEDILKDVELVRPARNRPLSGVSVCTAIRKIGRRAGISNICPHMLRRAFATHLYENGARPEIIQLLMGHQNFDTTMIYVRLSAGKVSKTFIESHPRGRMNVTEI